jgi:GntR family transcriptional regulator
MLLSIDNRSGVPIYRQVFDQVKQQILTGQTAPGVQAPSVRDLAAELKVNPMTVSKAYALLEAQGLLERRRGIGLFVRDIAGKQRLQQGLDLLKNALNNAAIAAVQLGVSKQDAMALYARYYDRFRSKGKEQE